MSVGLLRGARDVLYCWIKYTKVTQVSNERSSRVSKAAHCTVTRIDERLHQPHRMAPDQTIRGMEDKFDICNGHIWFFPIFPMDISYRFGNFRLDSLFKGWKSPTFRSFPIIFSLQRMEILEVSKISDFIPFSKDGNFRHFEFEYIVCITFSKKGNP
jgi:hypothetical protein